MQASDLAQALSVYETLVRTQDIRNAVFIDQLSSVQLKFKSNTPPNNIVYAVELSGEDLNEVTKVVRRQLLVEINQLTIQLQQLGVEL